jgi:hypothetical protein
MAKKDKNQNEKKCSPCVELGPQHMTALSLVGTVALPSPFPATGRILVVRHPPTGGGASAAPTYHIKIVQAINDSCIITRFVDHNAVSLIRFQPASQGESPGDKPFSLDHAGVQDLVSGLDWDVVDERASHEIEPFPQHTGVVHVPETQPTMLRYDLSVPAATSLEQLVSCAARCPRSCPPRKSATDAAAL